jgi:C4-dicarboxylate-specific signal transduction histidine kinase
MLLFLLRRRILQPLNNLRDLMAHLARQEYRSAATENVTPVLLPVFENYNHMVERLQELERHHRERQESLEAAVHRATATLLQQQRELARSERLAAVGEVAAGVAHELRNPLAGVQMALSGLHREPPVAVDLGRTLEELLELVRLQVPARVRLDAEVMPGLCCRLPEAGLRRAILNLLLNAAQAIGEREGHIHVTAAREAGQLRLSVTDDGPGLPAELLQDGVRAFASWREGGTGLGLAMVQRFARDQAGRLELGACEPRGACVSLRLRCGTNADE